MAIRRMMVRRGQIDVLFSDQGRNFIGTSQDLINALSTIDQEEMTRQLAIK